MTTKTVFISYSWDNASHSAWVLILANNLVSNGIDVLLDQYDLSVGKQMTYFMEKAMTADKVLVILTPNYKLKADKREGGVGYEYSLLTKEYYDKEPDKTRIFPVLKVGDENLSCPTFMQTVIYHDMRDEKVYDAKLFELIKLISDQPLVKKPPLGKLPDFDESIPDIDKTIIDFKTKEGFINRKNAIIKSKEGVELFVGEAQKIMKQIKDSLENYKKNFGLSFWAKSDSHFMLFSTVNFTSNFRYREEYNNDASSAYMLLDFYKGPYGFSEKGFDYRGPNEAVYKYTLDFSLDENFSPIFVKRENRNIKFTSHEIASTAVRDVIVNEMKLRESRLK